MAQPETDKQRRQRQLDQLAFEILAARHTEWTRWTDEFWPPRPRLVPGPRAFRTHSIVVAFCGLRAAEFRHADFLIGLQNSDRW
jgi:hypothetical protein